MPIPNIQTLRNSLLEIAADGNVHTVKVAREQLAEKFNLTEQERKALPPSGLGNPVFTNSVAWAAVQLGRFGYVSAPEQGQIQITPLGHQALKTGVTNVEIEFPLEKYLEEFLISNFHTIFNGKLEIYKNPQEPDVTGQQYNTNIGIIDILAREPGTNSLVVIELKKGRTADETLGQILRYMGWVSENLYKEGQTVKGIIVCKEPDTKLSYALKMTSNVKVIYYHIDFKLSETA